MDKTPHFFEYYSDILSEGNHCVMVELEHDNELSRFINSIPENILYKPEDPEYGREKTPHITVLYGIEASDEAKAKKILSKVPGKLVATLGVVSAFTNNPEFDVLKIDVDSPHLTSVNKLLVNTIKHSNSYPKYEPHVTLAYIKKGTGNSIINNRQFNGHKFLFDVFMYSGGSIDPKTHTKISMFEYSVGSNLGLGGGYGGAAGGAVAATNWAGTYSSPQTTNRLNVYPTTRQGSYMQGNTIIVNGLETSIKPEDLQDPRFSPDEIMAGLRWEMTKTQYPNKNKARDEVIRRLTTNSTYYSDLGPYNITGK